ncbi:hypothetical protein DRN86_04245 [Candidatus Geothermarchaeota archaeon]|nr:MAG: hypothetical protein DRN86_04245 [Candidatus Geothermarchaeota archaeon]
MESREKTIIELAKVFAGENGEKIVKYLLDKKEDTDEAISAGIDLPIGTVRRILYLLHDKGVISCRVERNPETGWITYFWFIPIEQINGVVYNLRRKLIARIEKRLEYETTNIFYWCGNNECPKITFSEAVDNVFRCPQCGRRLKPYDNSKLIAALNWTLSRLKAKVKRAFEH